MKYYTTPLGNDISAFLAKDILYNQDFDEKKFVILGKMMLDRLDLVKNPTLNEEYVSKLE